PTVMALTYDGTILRYWGYPNKAGIGISETRLWTQPRTELILEKANFSPSDIFEECGTDACDMPINLSIGSPGSITVSGINITYGTTIIPASGLDFKLANGSDVSQNAVFNDTDVYVWNSGTLVAKIPMNFSESPDYTNWTAEVGVNNLNGTFVITAPLNESNYRNTSLKTIYVKVNNASLSKICYLNSPTVGGHDIQNVYNESGCLSVSGSVGKYNTTTINGTTYFVIPNSENSGAVQILGATNPPVLSGSVSPSSGDQYTYFTFSLTVTDADNDTMNYVRVNIDGTSHDMTETDAADTDFTDGKEYSYATILSSGTHSYYFTAYDGSVEDPAFTDTESLFVSYTTTGGVTVSPAPGFDAALVAVLFVSAAAVLLVRKQ
ncbi:MAG: hypothetical protein QXO69_01905, partial [archaeon]